MSLEKTKKLYHKLVRQGVINKDIKMPIGNFMSFPLEVVKKLFNNGKLPIKIFFQYGA